MIPRYADPYIDGLWSDEWTYDCWLRIEVQVLNWQVGNNKLPYPGARRLLTRLDATYISAEAAGAIREIERDKTKHDFAAFLEWVRSSVEENDGSYLHFGLTSSDVIETTQGIRFQLLTHAAMAELARLNAALRRWAQTPDVYLAGRTHGQVAEPTSLAARANHWIATLVPASGSMVHCCRAMQVAKLSGPVGTFAHNDPEMEAAVAHQLRLTQHGRGASQIVPRTRLAQWASSAATVVSACAKIAMDLRLMNLLGEASWPQTTGQVGSSAMAHKNNPIVAEQVTGMARLAQGYAQMLQPLDLWLERDISHSSVERVAVPDLWHVLFQAIRQTTRLLQDLVVDKDMAAMHLTPEVEVHRRTLDGIRLGMSIEDARENALIEADILDPIHYQGAEWWLRNYPGAS